MSFYVIHLSDIHITNCSDLVMKRVECIKRTCAGSILDNSDVILTISGDIAYSGNEQQYTVARDLIDEISNYLIDEKKARMHFAIVPGNHDCDFTQNNSVRESLLKNIHPESDKAIFDNVTSIQSQYFSFAKQYDSDINGMISVKEINLKTGNVLFLLINTAWMSTIEEKCGKIVLPTFSIPDLNTDKYKMVFAVFHHPEGWFDPNYKQYFIDFIRKNADFALVGHEHLKDGYQKTGQKFSVLYNHGKELQDSGSDASGFSILEIQDSYDTYCVYDFIWKNNGYVREDGDITKFTPNRLVSDVTYRPNKKSMTFADDFGVGLHHFSKESISLSDLFIWPELNKVTIKIDKKFSTRIKTDIFDELNDNQCNIIVGAETSGKTAMAKKLYLEYSGYDTCCIYIDGREFQSKEPRKILSVIEEHFAKQYQYEAVDEFRRMAKNEKILIVDNFDRSKLHGEKRNSLFELLTNEFGKTFIFVSSEIELPTIFSSPVSNNEADIFYYEILPFGNKKRKELINKWYGLNTESYDDVDSTTRVEESVRKVNTFLGNGSGIMPAYPLSVLCVLAYSDSMTPTYNGSQYGFLYETMIQKSLSTIHEFKESGACNIAIGIVSQLAFYILQAKETSFTQEELNQVVEEFNKEKKENVSAKDLISKMCNAKLFYYDTSEGDVYRFKYPYVFYYFAGRYIAYHYKESNVENMIDYMSERLYIESYGNIMIFACHFANNKEVVETVLLNAYTTLEDYDSFDFSKSSSTVLMLNDLVDALMPKVVSSANDVTNNKDKRLAKLDDVGLIDGTVHDEEEIDDTVSDDEKDLAAIAASLKTMEVLGQILQNYPGDISGDSKIAIISEMHQMSMRTVQAIICTLSKIEDDFVDFVVSRSVKKGYDKNKIEEAARKFLHFLIAGMARGMISQVAQALNSKFLLQAAEECLSKDNSISAKLIFTELKVNKLKRVNYQEIRVFREELKNNDEQFALCILSSIMSTYLNYNQCDYKLRSKICALFKFTERKAIIASQSFLLEEKF